ncbi:hypothetical protein K438DRAFT_2074445 [Mycena galopus ATCC 62051]|nr:hypothetical protein K438DRAFT_2074445 [Mycena galopus ATCC 62051]
MGKTPKAPKGETINQLEARLAEIKKAAALPEKCSRGRPKASKNKPKALKTDADSDAKNDTTTDTSAKGPRPSKEPKSVKEPTINENIWWKFKQDVRLRGASLPDSASLVDVLAKHSHFMDFNAFLIAQQLEDMEEEGIEEETDLLCHGIAILAVGAIEARGERGEPIWLGRSGMTKTTAARALRWRWSKSKL